MRSRSWIRAVAAWIVVLAATAAATAADNDMIGRYYLSRDREADKPVLIFSTGDARTIGQRYLTRANVEYLPLAEAPQRLNQIKQVPTVFLIAREHLMQLPPELEALLPNLRSVSPDSVYIYGEQGKARYTPPGKRSGDSYTRVQMVIAAPTDEWLLKAIDQFKAIGDFPGGDGYIKSGKPNPITYPVRMVCAVAEKGLAAVPAYVGPAVPPPLGSAERPGMALLAAPRDGELERHAPWLPFAEEAYLLTYEELATLPASLRQRIPFDVSKLLPNQTLAVRREREGLPPAVCLVAPSAEKLKEMAAHYRATGVPVAPLVESMPDLRQVKTVLVAGATNLTGLEANLAPLLERALADLLGRARLFEGGVRSGQTDGNELKTVFAEMKLGMSGLTKQALDGLTVANADVLLLGSVTQASGKTAYASKRTQITANEPELSLAAEPDKPDVNERKYGFMGPKLYDGEQDPKYQQKLADWRRQHDAWEAETARARSDYERRLREKAFDWKWQILESSEATVDVSVRLFDLKTGAVIWAVPSLTGQARREGVFREKNLVVVGQGNLPQDPEPTPPTVNQAPDDLARQALQNAVDDFLGEFRLGVLLPGELPADLQALDLGNAPAENATPAAAVTETPQPTESTGTPVQIRGAVARVLEARPDLVIAEMLPGQAGAIKAGDLLTVVVEVEIRKNLEGKPLAPIERGVVTLRVQQVYEDSLDCAPPGGERVGKAQAGSAAAPLA